ncbi:MAG TPA: CHAT domain-containing protein [Flavilitoribacter sp.]|nr:CHAT domain-containing protein [Flavilitoribacter sp.]HMQ91398.1 CHAT domain-containing protein [Flavilitoribacter sp.]
MERTFIAPQMLKPEKPGSIVALENSWKLGPEPRFIQLRFTHPFLHYGIIQGFIVRAYQLARVDEIFRYGILLEWEGENAVVEAVSRQEIRITGSQVSTRLISMVRDLFRKLEHDGRWNEEISFDGEHFEVLDDKSELASIYDFTAKGKRLGFGRADIESLPEDFYSDSQPPLNKEISSSPKLRILFLTACPAGSDPIQPDKEFAVVYRSVSENVRLEVEDAVTSDNLIDKALEKDYPVIHFSGHGTEGDYDNREDAGLIFHNDGQNGWITINEEKLHNIFKAIKKQKQVFKIAFLNACFSASQAKAISEVGVHAIGFDGKLNDEAAWKFSAGFYKHFEKTGDIKESVERGALKAQVIDTDIIRIVNLFHNGETIPLDLN